MKKFLLSMASVAMLTSFANAEVITLEVKDATDIKGTEWAEVAKGDKDPQTGQTSQYGNAKHVQPLQSLVLGDFDFTFGNNGGKTEPAYYYPMSTNENGTYQLRIYGSNTMTISAPSDMPIGKVVAYDVKGKADVVIYSGTPTTEVTYSASAQVRFETFTITVGEAGDTPEPPVAVKGDSKENPFSVTEALEYIKKGGDSKAEKYVIGYITAISEVSTQYGNSAFTLSETKEGGANIDVFRCKYLNGEKFTSEDQINTGMFVIVKGQLMHYNANDIDQLAYGQLESLDASGVENVVVDNEVAPVYYNLQGVRVANPENGLFIVVKGNKTSKVVL